MLVRQYCQGSERLWEPWEGGGVTDVEQEQEDGVPHLVHHVVRQVSSQHVQHEAVSSCQVQVLQSPGSHVTHQDGPWGRIG